jgi:hypothetical protein
MQGMPLEDLEGYIPLLPNSVEGSPEGVVNNKVASKVGSTHSLEGFHIVLDSLESFQLPPNLLLSIRQDAHFLWMNSSREIFVVESTGVPIGPNVGSGVEYPLFPSESFRTPAHTAGVFNPSFIPLTVCDIYDNLGASPDQPMASQIPKTFVTYTIPLDNFIGTTSSVSLFQTNCWLVLTRFLLS